MKQYNNFLFDLDGTLTDPEEGIINSILYALDKMGIQENNRDELKSFIGPPLTDSFENRYQLSRPDATKAVTFFREYFSVHGLFENRLFEHIPPLLDSMFHKKKQLFVATSKPTIYAEKIIRHFNLDQYFEAIIGSHLDNTRTDKTEIIKHVLSTYKLNSQNTIMIGDRKFDMIGAKKNNVIAVGVTYGHGDKNELNLSGADFIVENGTELQALLLGRYP